MKLTKAADLARQLIEEDHEHSPECMEVESAQVDFWPTPDIDESYDRQFYVCVITGQDIDLEDADPEYDRAQAIADMEADSYDPED